MNLRTTPRFTAAVVLTFAGLAGAVMLGLGELALVTTPWCVLLVLGLGAARPTRPAIQVHANHARVVLGDEVQITSACTTTAAGTLAVSPALRRPSRVDHRGTPATEEAAHVYGIGPDRPATLEQTVRCDQWGPWRLEGHHLKVTSRFGLFVGEAFDETSVQVRVHPDAETLRQLVVPWHTRRSTGRHTARSSGSGVEFADIRPFSTGDEVRSINWRASARQGTLYVSDRHPDRSTDVILLLDSFVESGHDIERVLSLTVNAALAVCDGHLGFADRVGVVQFGGVLRWLPPRTGQMHLHRVTDFLLSSLAFSNQAEKSLPMLAPSAWPPRSTVVAFSPLLDPRFVQALHESRRRGHDVAVVEIDALDPRDLGAQDASQALATRLVAAERARMRQDLAERGIACALWRRDEPVDLAMAALLGMRRRLGTRA